MTAIISVPLNVHQQHGPATEDREDAPLRAPSPTVLGELGGGELRGDEERLFGAALEDEAGGDVRAAVVVLFAAGQAQVQRVVVKRAVLIALQAEAENADCFLVHATWKHRVPGDSWLILAPVPKLPRAADMPFKGNRTGHVASTWREATLGSSYNVTADRTVISNSRSQDTLAKATAALRCW